jgi:hypothetical protein
MENRITKAYLDAVIAAGEEKALIEKRIVEQIDQPGALIIDDDAVPVVVSILTPQGSLDRWFKNLLRGANRPDLSWKAVVEMASPGSRTRSLAIQMVGPNVAS